MKKIFLIFALTTLMSLGLIAEENKEKIQIDQNKEILFKISATTTPAISVTNLADSFMAKFGMGVAASGDTGKGTPRMVSFGNNGSMAIGISTISTTSSNQVTRSFTPYSYQK